MINYYDVCVNTARMINNPRASKVEIEKYAKRMFGYVGKTFDESAFGKAFTEFKKSDRKIYRSIYAQSIERKKIREGEKMKKHREMVLVWSPDKSVWYWEDRGCEGMPVSQDFKSAAAAERARAERRLLWNNDY